MLFQQRMDSPLQITNPFSMDHTHLQNALLSASFQIRQHYLFDFARRKRVQVQNAIDRQLNRFAELIIGLLIHLINSH